MDVQTLVAQVVNRIQVNQTLRAQTVGRLNEALGELAAAEELEQEASMTKELSLAEITQLRQDLAAQDAREAQYLSQLVSLQAMLQPEPEDDPDAGDGATDSDPDGEDTGDTILEG